jgi:hypothetical protein
MLCIRATIDHEIHRNSQGKGRVEVFQQACAELTKISHAENAISAIRPQPIRANAARPQK